MSKIAGAAMGLVPFLGTGLQAFGDAQRSIELGLDPLTAYGIAGVRGASGAFFDMLGPGWLRNAKNVTDIVGAGAAYGGMGAEIAGNRDLGNALSKGAEYLNPDTYIKGALYKLMPQADLGMLERKKRETELAYERVAAAQKDLDTTKSPTLTQVPPTEKDQTRVDATNSRPSTGYRGPLALTVDSDNIDSLLAQSKQLSEAARDANMKVRFLH